MSDRAFGQMLPAGTITQMCGWQSRTRERVVQLQDPPRSQRARACLGSPTRSQDLVPSVRLGMCTTLDDDCVSGRQPPLREHTCAFRRIEEAEEDEGGGRGGRREEREKSDYRARASGCPRRVRPALPSSCKILPVSPLLKHRPGPFGEISRSRSRCYGAGGMPESDEDVRGG
ncbi:uncharacterized protein LOC143184146 [Calliopsis andreniformis]|uniref:uncharacterized protein LOC143184146 n=1 Tax=Calliopsis andreniformis TaxID=337506 RepID=UPI003FCEB328